MQSSLKKNIIIFLLIVVVILIIITLYLLYDNKQYKQIKENFSGVTLGLLMNNEIKPNTNPKFPTLFYIKTMSGKTWNYDSSSNTIKLKSGTPLQMSIYNDSSVYKNSLGTFGLKDNSTGKYVRHGGYYMMLENRETYNKSQFVFGWVFMANADGSFKIYNDYKEPNKSFYVGYDSVKDQILIVPDKDPRIVNWVISSELNIITLPRSIFPDRFTISKQINTQTLKLGTNNTIKLTGQELNISIYNDPLVYKNNLATFGLKNNSTNTYIRHTGYWMSLNSVFAIANLDFGWVFIANTDGSFKIYNHYKESNKSFYVGYDYAKDQILIVPEGDAKICNWFINPINLPTTDPRTTLPPNTQIANISEANRTYSSIYGNSPTEISNHSRSTINSLQAWSYAGPNDKTPWMQINLPDNKNIVGVVIQGRADYLQYVTKFKVSYIDNNNIETPVDNGMEYDGVQDITKTYYVLFTTHVFAKSIKIYPTVAYQNAISMRADVLLPIIKYSNSLPSNTQELSIPAVFRSYSSGRLI